MEKEEEREGEDKEGRGKARRRKKGVGAITQPVKCCLANVKTGVPSPAPT